MLKRVFNKTRINDVFMNNFNKGLPTFVPEPTIRC